MGAIYSTERPPGAIFYYFEGNVAAEFSGVEIEVPTTIVGIYVTLLDIATGHLLAVDTATMLDSTRTADVTLSATFGEGAIASSVFTGRATVGPDTTNGNGFRPNNIGTVFKLEDSPLFVPGGSFVAAINRTANASSQGQIGFFEVAK